MTSERPPAGHAVEAAMAAFEASLPFALDAFQREAIEKLERSAGVLVAAPTSSGKTLVAEYPMWRCVLAPAELRRPYARVIYTSPLKALSNQKFHDLATRYGAENVGLITGEHTLNDGAPLLVMTTEILRNVLYDDPARLDLVSDVVLDEIHYIDDHPRGTVWEEIIIETPARVRLIGLSATISNVDEVAAWMGGLRGDIGVVVRTERPVPLQMWLSHHRHGGQRLDARGALSLHAASPGQRPVPRHRGAASARHAARDLLHLLAPGLRRGPRTLCGARAGSHRSRGEGGHRRAPR
jgi:ATP-dependent RNA helicase HelY